MPVIGIWAPSTDEVVPDDTENHGAATFLPRALLVQKLAEVLETPFPQKVNDPSGSLDNDC